MRHVQTTSGKAPSWPHRLLRPASSVFASRKWRITGLAVTAALFTSACAGPGTPSRARVTSASSGGVATFADPVGSPPNYIFPMYAGYEAQNSNITYFQPLMFRPLYWFGHPNSSAVSINYNLSLGDPPVYSDGGKTVTITLKHYLWSDGQPVTSRDVEFWMNLLLNDEPDWGIWAPGDWSTHIVSMSFPSSSQFSITFNQAFSKTYLLYNGLAQITPIPQQSWDRTSLTGPIGNYDTTASGAQAVYSFLNTQSLSLATWDTNSLWQTVDGPWRLEPGSGFDPTTGTAILIPNRHYSGTPKPTLSKFELLPFTSSAAEVDALLSGNLDYGYLPFTDLGLGTTLKRKDFRTASWYYWGISYIPLNFTNPAVAPLFNQLYIRQAMQHLIDQPVIVSKIFEGYGSTQYGPVPEVPANDFTSRQQSRAIYPYSVSDAVKLLKAHGWTGTTNGQVATCTAPGTAANECGQGVSQGEKLDLSLLYASGVPYYTEVVEELKSSFGDAGISLSLRGEPFDYLIGQQVPCDTSSGAGCSWDMAWIGAPTTTFVPTYYPSGEIILGTGAPDNVGGYANPANQANILASHVENGASALYAYENFAQKQIPILWMPNSVYQISVINKKLLGVGPQDATNHIYPEDWSLSSS